MKINPGINTISKKYSTGTVWMFQWKYVRHFEDPGSENPFSSLGAILMSRILEIFFDSSSEVGYTRIVEI
jgi:hypothetical protein